MKKIVLFSSEPGGIEILRRVFRRLRNNYEVYILAMGHAADRLQSYGEDFIHMDQNDFENDFKQILFKLSPDYILTSATSIAAQNPFESLIWKIAEQYQRPTVAFLDQWQNYVIRFSSDGLKIDLLPRFINCIDQNAFSEMIKLGFPAEKLVPLGQPYLDDFVNETAHGTAVSMGIIGFSSEAIYENFGRKRGYDQFDALKVFADILKSRSDLLNKKVIIKLHPKEQMSALYSDLFASVNMPVQFIKNEISPDDFVRSVDELWGMTSVMLIQSYLIGKPTYSIQPFLQQEDPLVLTRQGMLTRIESAVQLSDMNQFNHLIDKTSLPLSVRFDDNQFRLFLENIK